MLLQTIKCPQCGHVAGRIMAGVSEHDCRRCKLRLLVGVVVDTGAVVVLQVDSLPKTMALSA